MKHVKKIFAAAVLGFLAFAPPGTLIFIGILLLSFLGKTWFIVGLSLGVVSLAVYGFIYREKMSQIGFVRNISRKFKK